MTKKPRSSHPPNSVPEFCRICPYTPPMGSSDPILDVNWPGKYAADGSRTPYALPEHQPLRTLERWAAAGKLFEPSGLLVHGDNLKAGPELLDRFGGKVRLIYLDPPFNLGRPHHGRFHLAPRLSVDLDCFDDSWGEATASFAHFMWQRLHLCRDLLADDGSIFLHGNDHTAPLLRALLDDVFGPERFLNQIIWHYTGGGRSKRVFSNKHDVIFWYAKGRSHIFNIDAVRQPYSPTSGYAKGGITATSGKHYTPHPDGTPADDVWDIPMINPLAAERSGYATQKPLALMERIVTAASNPGDLVADLFSGAGTTAVAAHQAGREFLACDAGGLAVAVTRMRLLQDGAAFELAGVNGYSSSRQQKVGLPSEALAKDGGTGSPACGEQPKAGSAGSPACVDLRAKLSYRISDNLIELSNWSAPQIEGEDHLPEAASTLAGILCWSLISVDEEGQPLAAHHYWREKSGATLPTTGRLPDGKRWQLIAYDIAGRRWVADVKRDSEAAAARVVW